MKVKHTYYHNNPPYEDTSEVKGIYAWTMGEWLSKLPLKSEGLCFIRNGIETLISMQDGYPTIEVSMDEAEHVHLYQIIEEQQMSEQDSNYNVVRKNLVDAMALLEKQNETLDMYKTRLTNAYINLAEAKNIIAWHRAFLVGLIVCTLVTVLVWRFF